MHDENIIRRFYDEKAYVERSPKVEGIIQGSKAAILAAPIVAAIQALRGKNPYIGGLAGAAAAGATAGLLAAAKQKLTNMEAESNLKYHLNNIPRFNEEPFVPPAQSGNFGSGFYNVYNQN